MTFNKLLSETFPNADKTKWQKAALSEIHGNVIESLQWETSNLRFDAYYDQTDLSKIKYLNNFLLQDNATEYSGPRSWSSIAHVPLNEDAIANQLALDHLKNGADGIVFNLPNRSTDFNVLLEKIEWPYCTILFLAHNNYPLTSLNHYFEQNYKDKELPGAIFWSDIKSINVPRQDIGKFKKLGLYINASSPVEEIAEALTRAVQLIDQFQEISGYTPERIINNIAFSIPISNTMLVEVAKLKALRILWYQITQAFQLPSYQPDDLYIHTRSEVYVNEKYQPHGNMLSNTISSMAAIAGGCNAHTIYAASDTEKWMNRIAINTSTILRDEAHFGRVADVFAGSYTVDTLVDKLSHQAWEKFKSQIK